jgi:hypothetical protein
MNYDQTSPLYRTNQYESRYSTATHDVSLYIEKKLEDMVKEHLIKQALTERARIENEKI